MADFGLNRNGSGYYDETAYKAFMGMAHEGEIWTTLDGRQEALILRNQGTFCNCLTMTDRLRDKQCIEISGGRYTNPGMIKYLFNDKLGRLAARLPVAEFETIREAVEAAMGFKTQDVKIDMRKEVHDMLDMILDKVGAM